jgi:CubicO group peptidase (beta-lactamase class C family)
MRKACAIILLCAFVTITQAVAQDQAGYFPPAQWRTSPPQDQALDKKILKKLVKKIRGGKIGGLDSLLIVRNGYLVTEEYFRGWGRDDLHTLQSDTKSITSLLVGAALLQGKIASVNEKVVDLFPEYRKIKNLDDRKASMSLQDLLTMRTGFDWSEDNYAGSPLQQLNDCQCDWMKFVLNWPMRDDPGTRFEYNSGGVILLGGVIRNATEMPTDVFAQRSLFDPLGITQVRWYYGQDGSAHTGGGLNMRPQDMAKIGYLVLRNGRWEDKQIVSEDWLKQSMQHAVRSPRTFGSHWVDYGYLWWLLPLDAEGPDADIYTASGALGQWIFIIPRFDMVVVVTGNAQTYTDWAGPVEFLYTDILRAVR